MAKSLLSVVICIIIINLVGPNLWTVKGVDITDVFEPIHVCHKAIYLYGPLPDDNLTEDIIRSLTSLYQPFEIHTKQHMDEVRFNDYNLIAHFTCLAHIVLVRDSPTLRTLKMNLLLKRFNRKAGNENDFVLVFALTQDGISTKWTDWRQTSLLRYIMVKNFPDNALLIELDECAENGSRLSRYSVSNVYSFQLYCDEDQEACWMAEPGLSTFFPKLKSDWDTQFIRVRAHWRYNYNQWPILYLDLGPGDFDGIAKMTFRQATWGRYTWDEYLSDDYFIQLAPSVWLTFAIADHLNATLIRKSTHGALDHATEILPRAKVLFDRVLKFFPSHRNVHIQYSYITFGYCTYGTRLRESMKILAIFKPFDLVCWILLGLALIATAIVPWFAGLGVQILQVLACLGLQSIKVNSNSRLAMILLLWQVVAFLVSNFYAAFIESILAAPDLLPRIQSFKELNESCEVPWILSGYRETYKEKFSGVPHLKALIDRSNETNSVFLLRFFRYNVDHEKQCAIYQSPVINAPLWTELSQKLAPDATCTEGNEKLISDPLLWHIEPPNAAIVYRTVRALEAAGILMKFGEYQENKIMQGFHHFTRLNLEYKTNDSVAMEDTNSKDDFNLLSMSNSQVQALFTTYFGTNSFAFSVFLVECIRLFVEVSNTN